MPSRDRDAAVSAGRARPAGGAVVGKLRWLQDELHLDERGAHSKIQKKLLPL